MQCTAGGEGGEVPHWGQHWADIRDRWGSVCCGNTWVYRDRDKRFLWESTPLKWAAVAPCWTGQLWRQRELLGFIGCDSLLMFACRHTSANEASMENRNMWMSAGINNSHKNVFGIRPKLLCGKHAFQGSQIQFDSLWLISLCCTVWTASSFNSDVID